MDFKYSTDIIPVSEARARLPELLDEVKAGATKVITRNGHASAALIDIEELDALHRLRAQAKEFEWLEGISASLDDIDKGRVSDSATFFDKVKRDTKTRRKAKRG
ncbi:MAG: type II toxin-antitoxin system Phd/YefM family antitoxin [Archangium sp.]